ncbi:MAG: hypothetical protein A2451_13270 [Bdellovibrionales bacterium RIFOXYC2_FULL_39_8]|nr:MAG: hypothetical protein A2451_13270 [Bdellovibrionales bacterium RIFOXYC2_FULL_39_8]
MYTGANLSAKEALAYGLVTKLFKNKEEMMAGAKMVISMMAKNSRQAIAEAKKVMNLGNDLTVKDGLKIEVSSFSKLFQTEEMKEGTNAFMQKRKANF